MIGIVEHFGPVALSPAASTSQASLYLCTVRIRCWAAFRTLPPAANSEVVPIYSYRTHSALVALNVLALSRMLSRLMRYGFATQAPIPRCELLMTARVDCAPKRGTGRCGPPAKPLTSWLATEPPQFLDTSIMLCASQLFALHGVHNYLQHEHHTLGCCSAAISLIELVRP